MRRPSIFGEGGYAFGIPGVVNAPVSDEERRAAMDEHIWGDSSAADHLVDYDSSQLDVSGANPHRLGLVESIGKLTAYRTITAGYGDDGQPHTTQVPSTNTAYGVMRPARMA